MHFAQTIFYFDLKKTYAQTYSQILTSTCLEEKGTILEMQGLQDFPMKLII
jgi:hypothetical protein